MIVRIDEAHIGTIRKKNKFAKKFQWFLFCYKLIKQVFKNNNHVEVWMYELTLHSNTG